MTFLGSDLTKLLKNIGMLTLIKSVVGNKYRFYNFTLPGILLPLSANVKWNMKLNNATDGLPFARGDRLPSRPSQPQPTQDFPYKTVRQPYTLLNLDY